MSSRFFATYSQVDTSYQVVIHALGGTNVDTADLRGHFGINAER